ncbi:MAG TPA: hypothetical protein VGJ28_08200 [Micromonosporaceae bacterium]|jgi:hypothetical protein
MSTPIDVDRVWRGVAAQVWRRQPSAVERLAARLLRSPGLARALVTTPSLLVAWLIATVVIIAVGAAATAGTGTPYLALCAPAVAGAGIAYAYGPGIDPAWELSRSMAVSDRTVLLARALAVFGFNALLGVAGSLAASAVVPLTVGWLLPMTAVCAVALGVATLTHSANAGVAAGLGGWAITVIAGWAAAGSVTAATTNNGLMMLYACLAAIGVAAIWLGTRIPGAIT